MTNIVMITRDRSELVDQALSSLYVNTDSKEYNLTLIDDGSEMPAEVFLAGKNWMNKKVLNVPSSDHNLGWLKSLGIVYAQETFGRGDWLCVCDNDCFFQPKWMERMIEMAEGSWDLGFRLWSGQNHPYHPKNVVNGRPGMWEASTLAGTMFWMKWSTWNTYGPFLSEGPGVCKGEDVKFSRDVISSGWRIGISRPDCVLDCGLTQTGGTPSPGIDVKRSQMIPGVKYA